MLSFLIIATIPLWTAGVYQLVTGNSVYTNDTSKKQYLFFCCAVIWLIIGLRHYDMGSVDSRNYYSNWILVRDSSFSQIKALAEISDMETGYLYTVAVLSRIFRHPQFVFVLSGLLFSTAIGTFVYKNSDNVIISMLLFICLGLYTFILQGLRQGIAISICLFSIEFVKKRKLIPFLLLLALAYCYHRSSIVFGLTYFLYGSELTAKAKIKYLCVAAILILMAPFLKDTANELWEKDYENEAKTGTALVATLTYLIILFAGYLFLSEKNTNKDMSFFVSFTIVGTAFYLLRYTQAQVFERISFYFLAGQIILLPAIVRRFDVFSRKILNVLIVCLAVALFLYRVRASYASAYFFFWQK